MDSDIIRKNGANGAPIVSQQCMYSVYTSCGWTGEMATTPPPSWTGGIRAFWS